MLFSDATISASCDGKACEAYLHWILSQARSRIVYCRHALARTKTLLLMKNVVANQMCFVWFISIANRALIDCGISV